MAFGYLSVLLSFTCIDNVIRQQVLSQLKSKSLNQLLSAVKEFLQYHTKIDQEIYERDGESNLTISFTGRLKKVVEKLEKASDTSALAI